MALAINVQISDYDVYRLQLTRLDQLPGRQVPIIRIYGALRVPHTRDLAYSVVVHVHNYYPYLYLECPISNYTQAFLSSLKDFLELQLAESFRSRQETDSDEEEDPNLENPPSVPTLSRFIAAVDYCRGVPMYGYHLGYKAVLKVLFLLPRYKTRFTRLMAEHKMDFSGLAQRKKPLTTLSLYEAHINYFSQFLADYNLYGCSWLEASKCHFRTPIVLETGIELDPLKAYLESFIEHNNVLRSSQFPRMGRTTLEIDIHAGDILNRHRLHESHIHNDFSEFNGKCPKAQIYLSSLQWAFDDLKFQCTLRNNTETSQLLHKLYSQVFKNIGKGGYCDWETSDEMQRLLPYVADLNKPQGNGDPNQYYDKVIAPNLGSDSIPTCFSIVGKTAGLRHYEDVPLLNFRDDLVQWTRYDKLFEGENEPGDNSIRDTNSTEVEVPREGSNDSKGSGIGESDVRESGTNDINIRESDSIESENGIRKIDSRESDTRHSSSTSDSELDSVSSPVPPNQTQFSSQGLDLHILAMSQRRPVSQLSVSDFSTGLLTQTLHSLLCQPKSTWEYAVPPSLQKKRIKRTMDAAGVLNIDYSDPAYTKRADLHAQPLIFANRKIVVPLREDENVPYVVLGGQNVFCAVSDDSSPVSPESTIQTWQYARNAPSRSDITQKAHELAYFHARKRVKFKSQVEPAVTQTNDFKYSYRPEKVERSPSGFLNMTLMHMEVHASTDSENVPDPKKDPVSMVTFHFDNANRMHLDGEAVSAILISTAEMADPAHAAKQLGTIGNQLKCQIHIFSSEQELVRFLIQQVHQYDPDILSGYEVNLASWGYVIERFQHQYGERLMPELSRASQFANGKFGDRWGYTHTSAIKINGRHMLNVWRLLKSDLSLTSYTLENVCFHTLHQTLPKFLNWSLSRWMRAGSFAKLYMLCSYHKRRVDLAVQILTMQEFVVRNIEQSRIIGVDFYSNFYRGSQFKVESILLRIAKAENLLANSPSKAQVHGMRALDVVPLIMEPECNFYKSPLAVLDFQSLYPSIMIAYNYCYSTLLGHVDGFRPGKNTAGYLSNLRLPAGILDVLRRHGGLTISPNGCMFVLAKFRKSTLAKMLEEILNMRINMRSVAAAFPADKELSQLLNSKQLAMKLIANVTYGYTSATFSGRMPNSDIADAIVSTGRELMAKSIQIIESSEFGAKVVYGDTDSLFVYFPGQSRADAFRCARQLAQTVSDTFPDPIKLKFEKIYHPCVLLAKKRYVGHCYEAETQKTGKFEAKGIETVRRDGVPAQLKMVGKSLRILFETKDLSLVKEYVVRQFVKIQTNRANVRDFCFAKAVRYGTYKNEQYLPPGAIVARNRMQNDPRSEPQYKERVAYLVVKDVTKTRVKDRCFSPHDYLASYRTPTPMQLDYDYYITRVLIPPLERVFNLMGVKVKEWYRDMARHNRQLVVRNDDIANSVYFQPGECFRCGRELSGALQCLCKECNSDKVELGAELLAQAKVKERQNWGYVRRCRNCTYEQYGGPASDDDPGSGCCNEECEILYASFKTATECARVQDRYREMLTFVDNSMDW